MAYKQINIFGEDIIVKNQTKGKITIKNKFRLINGFIKNKYCKDCKSFMEYTYNNKKYFKCIEIGVSSSSATDIRKKDIACKLYIKKQQ